MKLDELKFAIQTIEQLQEWTGWEWGVCDEGYLYSTDDPPVCGIKIKDTNTDDGFGWVVVEKMAPWNKMTGWEPDLLNALVEALRAYHRQVEEVSETEAVEILNGDGVDFDDELANALCW